MDGDTLGRILYLLLLLLAVGGWFAVANRESLGKTVQQGLVWVLIFVGVVAVAGLWSDLRDDVMPRQSVIGDGARIEVPRGFDGHYHIGLEINGKPVRFVIDTGASDIVLTRQDAVRVGIDPDRLAYLSQAQTANGLVPIARVTLDRVALGGVVDQGVGASVNGGEMSGSLLGMSYLNRFGRIEIADGKLILER
ncbi:retropepsin-like aspartic protease family protein [Oceaniglobus trochenteri]|uniref:retropepsin-like aspartic protease family protein n=1 Tax=Oceaniglobus trochenteri TaxID=2763260 RepID=UPI001D00049B|nr:TIGR02281 family clan AA aspartic protease [Oceaniglobus trochenteri]